jgi:DNA repair protein RadC
MSVEQAALLAHGVLRGLDREALGAVYLNPADRLLGFCIAYVGTIDRLVVEPRGLLVPRTSSKTSQLISFSTEDEL